MFKFLFKTDQQFITFTRRYFPRATGPNQRWVQQEQQKNTDTSHRILKPVDGTRGMRYAEAKSLKERKLMGQADVEYNKFVQESVENGESDKQIDRIIDDMLSQGEGKYTDSQIIDRVAQMTGTGGKAMSRKDMGDSEDQAIRDITAKLKKQGVYKGNPLRPSNIETSPEMEEFEDFQDRAGKMMYQTDQILLEKWEKEERDKRKRSLEPANASVGEVDRETMRQDKFRPTQISEEVLTKREKRLQALFQNEASKAQQLIGPDSDFGKMVTQDMQNEQGLQDGANFDERLRDIVGFKREKVINLNATKKLTTAQKIEKELAYVTEAMDLDANLQKHWYYRLKREYEAQAKLERRMAERQAKKDYRKLLKKYGFKKELDEIEDYESFYNEDKNVKKEGEEDSEESDGMSEHFKNDRERAFYKDGEDMAFVRYHKRVTRNFHKELQEIIESDKQTNLLGVQRNYRVTINYIRLNKASTVVNAWWTLQVLPPEMVDERIRIYQERQEKDWIEQEMQQRYKEIQKQNEDQDMGVTPNKLPLKMLTPKEILVARDNERLDKIQAEIQKKLTKASGYFAGQLTKALGLRYAPDIRFFKDNTLEILKTYEEERDRYMEQAKEEDESRKAQEAGEMIGPMKGSDKPIRQLLEYIKIFKRLSPGERIAYMANVPDDMQEQVAEIMDNDSANEMKLKLEEQLVKMSEAQNQTQEKENLKMTRRDKRVTKQMTDYTSKLSEAAGKNVDFDKVTTGPPMSPMEMDNSILNIAGTVEPQLTGKKSTARYGYDPIRGEKIRLDRPKKEMTKSEKKKQKAKEFWAQLQ